MTTTTTTIRIDSNLKKEVENHISKYGLSLNALINIKLKEFMNTKKIDMNEYDDTNIGYYNNSIKTNSLPMEDFLEELKR